MLVDHFDLPLAFDLQSDLTVSSLAMGDRAWMRMVDSQFCLVLHGEPSEMLCLLD